MPKYFRNLLFGTVFFTGTAVLIFEITAVRALSPYFGASIYVVSSVLTVVLAALSLGYYFGGRLADRRPDVNVLYVIIAFSGLMMNLLYILSTLIFPIAGAFLPTTFGPLILSVFFFFFPAFLLGIDSPFAIKLLTKTGDDQHNGAIVGSTFFWSTVGSIVGSLASGFILIPFVGVKFTFIGTATSLSIFACLAYLIVQANTRNKAPGPSTSLMFAVTLFSVLLAAFSLRMETFNADTGKILYHKDGYYSQLEIREVQVDPYLKIRSLHREINQSSAIKVGSTDFVFRYTEYSRAYKYLQDKTNNFLLLGGGAYTIPRTLLAEDPDLNIDVVEIEPRLFNLAQTYFELPESPRLRNFPMDARTYLHTTDEKYDVIFADAFQSGHFVPPHLATREFFSSLKGHLNPEGILIANIIGLRNINDKTLTGSLFKTIKSVFPNPKIYAAQTNEERLHNIILIARADGAEVLLPADFYIDMKDGTSVPAISRERSLDDFYLDKQIVFTDDLAPVELLVAKQILQY